MDINFFATVLASIGFLIAAVAIGSFLIDPPDLGKCCCKPGLLKIDERDLYKTMTWAVMFTTIAVIPA